MVGKYFFEDVQNGGAFMTEQFHVLFENYLQDLTNMDKMDPNRLSGSIVGLCNYLGISKISVDFYQNPRAEAIGKFKNITYFDTGEQGVAAIHKRVMTEVMSVTDCTIYRAASFPEWDEEKLRQACIFNDVTMMAVSRNSILQVALRRTFYDDDGYKNLNTFIKHIESLSACGRLKGNAAIHFNLKHFSLINQQIGRDCGTTVMHGFIDGLTALAGDNGIVCRMGGDNFVALIPVSLLEQARKLLLGSAIAYNELGDRVMVSATSGILVIDEEFSYKAPSSVLDRIISASQAAKGSSEDIVFFSDEMEKRKAKLMRLQQLFPQALSNGEFLIYYQPKVEIRTGRLIGAEALCRWQHDGDIVKPDDFIPTFEKSMDICRLDFYMLEHVCKDIKGWLDSGREVVRVSVNLSRKHMMDIDLVDDIVGIIDKWQVPHRYIEIELTETTTDVEFKDLKRVVSGLQRAGISTAVDDFGIGYSSLNLISEIPWNVLKIDKSLIPVKGDNEQSPRSVMFGHVVQMAKDMGLQCISEGVETQEQIDAMLENGCDMVQGFFFDKPLPKTAFEQRLDEGGYSK